MLLVEHHPMMCEALRGALSPLFAVAGEAATCRQALEMCLNGLRPDIVIVDCELPDTTGVEATHALLSVNAGLRVILLIGEPDDRQILESIRAGAMAVVTKSEPAPVLREAVTAVAQGRSYLSLVAGQPLVNRLRDRTEQPAAKRLRARELQVCRLVAKGSTNKQIAQLLTKLDGTPIAVNTVRSYRKTAMQKLGAKNGVELVNIMRRDGILLVTSASLKH